MTATKLKYSEWQATATRTISEALVDCLERERHGAWAENYITTELLRHLEKIGTRMVWSDARQQIHWEGYKLTGTEEKEFGDIAIFVRVWLTDEEYVDGVAYYEAKRQYFDDDKKVIGFKSIKYDQLDRISKHTHAAHVILYDASLDEKVGLVRAVPIQFVKELAKGPTTHSRVTASGRVLHHYGVSWVDRLGNNLRGFDLDFSRMGVNAIRGLAAKGGVSVVLNASASLEHLRAPKLDQQFSRLPNLTREWGEQSAQQQVVVEPNKPTKERDDFDRSI